MATTRKRRRKRRSSSDDPQHWPWKTIVLYGDSGVGKTTLAATAPKPMILDSNMGLLSIDHRPGYEHVRSKPVSSMSHLERYYDRFKGSRKPSWKGRYETVVFDHFDDIQGIVLDELTDAAAERDPRRLDDPAQKDYGIMGNRLRRHIRKYKSLPVHKIMIHATGMDKVSGKAQPNLIGQLRNQLPYFADIIIYMRVSPKGARYIYLDGTDDYVAKCRAWWIKERRIRVPENDPKFLTNFLARIAAGPRKSTRSGDKTSKE